MILNNARNPKTIAVSLSESPDMGMFGLSEEHLRETMAEFAIYLLAAGENLAYGGDLRIPGFTDLLFNLVLRYRRGDETCSEARATDYLAWPAHIRMTADALNDYVADLHHSAQLVLIGKNGERLSMEKRKALPSHEPNDQEWSEGLTAMRQVMLAETDVRILLGGQVEGYKGRMPGIAEEALLSLQSGQPVFFVGGFGGCTRDIAEDLGLVDTWAGSRPAWPGRHEFNRWTGNDLHNGLSIEENRTLAATPYIDQLVFLVQQGIYRLHNGITNVSSDSEENTDAH